MTHYLLYKDNGTVLRLYFSEDCGWTNSVRDATVYEERSDALHVANKLQHASEFPIWLTEKKQ